MGRPFEPKHDFSPHGTPAFRPRIGLAESTPSCIDLHKGIQEHIKLARAKMLYFKQPLTFCSPGA